MPLRRTDKAIALTAAKPVANGVPPPPGRAAKLRLARTKDRVGGNTISAVRPRKAIIATSSRRM